jgi:hypothetical protein
MPIFTITYTTGNPETVDTDVLTFTHDPSLPATVTQYVRNGRDMVSISADLQGLTKTTVLEIQPAGATLVRQKAFALIKPGGNKACSIVWGESGANAILQIITPIDSTDVLLTNGLPPPKLPVKILQPSA